MPKGKLTSWANLKLRAIDPAVTEVCTLSDFVVEGAPIKTGRRVTHVELRWWHKDATAEAQAEQGLSLSKLGRKERAQAQRPRPVWLEARGETLRPDTYETAHLRYPGYDIYHVEGEWRDWAKAKEPPHDADRVFLAFFKTFAAANPI